MNYNRLIRVPLLVGTGHPFLSFGFRFAGCVCVAALLLATVPAHAQTTQQTFVLGGGANNLQIANDQKIMLEAANKLVQKDYRSAESMYTQAIALNQGNIEAYLQRAVARREMEDENGMASDARAVISLADNALQQNPKNPTLYYQRGMGYRLLHQFDQARDDITMGMQIGGKSNWKTDLQAIELERKSIK